MLFVKITNSLSVRDGVKGQSLGAAVDRRNLIHSPPKRSLGDSSPIIPRKQVRLEPKRPKVVSSVSRPLFR